MTPFRAILLAIALFATLGPSPSAATTNGWRTFTTADGLPDNNCASVTVGASANILIRHANTNVLSVFDGYEVRLVPAPDNKSNRVYESPGGQLWTVATNGLLEFRGGGWFTHRVPQVAAHFAAGRTNEVSILPVRQGRVLILLADELLQITVVEPERAQIEALRHDGQSAQENFNSLKPPPDGTQWIATSNGLLRHAPELWQERRALLGTNETNLPSNARRSASDLSDLPPDRQSPRPTARFTARNGDLWLGGANEIAWRHRGVWKVFPSTNQLGPENIVAFAEAPDGRIWCATPDRVWEFDGRNWLGLRGGFDHINALLAARDGTLWVATENGAHRFTRGAWIGNDIEDGMSSASVRDFSEAISGVITAHTGTGENVFAPEADTDAPQTFATVSGGETNSIREGALVTLTFHGRDRWKQCAANRLLFSHRLDEREWSPFLDATEASFGDLALGKHYFQVRALDRAGNMDPQPAKLEFTIAAPWFRQPQLVLVLTGALVVSLFFGAVALNRHRHLRHSYAAVERLIAERTRELELANRELLHSQKMNALGSLAAGIAHDFNNILSIIKGSAQIIEENAGNPEKIRTRVDRIKTVVQQGAEVVEAMLGFSRNTDAPPAPCDINAVVTDTRKLLGDRFLREMEVQFVRGENLPEVLVARDFVQQILLNFIFNAAEASSGTRVSPVRSDRQQILLTTRASAMLPEELALAPAPAPSFVFISVRDHGCGIAPEIRPRIFEPFFTTKALSSRRGTGLGLSMAYELAKKLGAGLAVDSTPGAGSEFTLILCVKA